MSSRLTHLALASLLAAPVALAAPHALEHTGSFTQVDSDAAKQVGWNVTRILDLIDVQVDLGQPIQTSLSQLAEQVELMPGSTELRARLSRHAQDLAERAGQSFVDRQDVARLRARIVHAVVDESLADLRRLQVEQKMTADQATGVFQAWVAQARIFIDAPDPVAYRARVSRAAEIAAIGARDAAEAIMELRIMLLDGRLEEARQELLQRVEEGTVLRQDYLRLYDLMARRARLIQAQGIGE